MKIVINVAWIGDDMSGVVFAGAEAIVVEVLAAEVPALAGDGYLWLATTLLSLCFLARSIAA
jgi:hypothetical protein